MKSITRVFATLQVALLCVAKLFIIMSPKPWPLFENADDLATIAFLAALFTWVATWRHNPELYFCSLATSVFGMLALIEGIRMLAEETSAWQSRDKAARANDVACYAKLQATKHLTPNAYTLVDACRGSTNYYSGASYVLPGTESGSDDGTTWIVFEWIFIMGLLGTFVGMLICNIHLFKRYVEEFKVNEYAHHLTIMSILESKSALPADHPILKTLTKYKKQAKANGHGYIGGYYNGT
jgi:hypothetical protein